MWSLFFPSTLYDFFACDLTRAFCDQKDGDCGDLNVCQYVMLFIMSFFVVFLVVMIHLVVLIMNEINSLAASTYDERYLTPSLEDFIKMEAGIREDGDYHLTSYSHLKHALYELNRNSIDPYL